MQDESTIPLGFCQCGCGRMTKIVRGSQASKGLVRGQPRRFIHGHQNRNTSPEWVVQENGCWRWLHCVDYHGYGRSSRDGRIMQAHRDVYARFRGPISDSLDLDHTCHNLDDSCPGGPCLHRRCVNPEHLDPVTHAINLRRGKGPTGANARKTACKYGHPFDDRNTYIRQGRRDCRTCNREKAANLRERRRGNPEPFPYRLT